jgi:hypothetical protein
MSRQMVRQRPPAEDDLQPVVDEEVRKLAQAAVGTTKLAPSAPQAARPAHGEAAVQGGSHAADRNAYFSGQYSPVASAGPAAGRKGLEMIIDRRMGELGMPDTLRHCVLDLIQVLRERGLGAALAALQDDPAIDRRYEGQVRSLLAAIDREDQQTPA